MINNLRFADDIDLIAEERHQLQELTDLGSRIAAKDSD